VYNLNKVVYYNVMTTATERPVTVTAVSYEVTAYPFHDFERHHFTLFVNAKGAGRWAIMNRGECWNKVGKAWDYEMLPSGREDDWLSEHRYDSLEEALEDAKAIAPFITLMNWTIDQVIRMHDGEELCGAAVTRGVRCDLGANHEGEHRP
jgi:hypothetical protein